MWPKGSNHPSISNKIPSATNAEETYRDESKPYGKLNNPQTTEKKKKRRWAGNGHSYIYVPPPFRHRWFVDSGKGNPSCLYYLLSAVINVPGMYADYQPAK
jgi:hypothetical protein